MACPCYSYRLVFRLYFPNRTRDVQARVLGLWHGVSGMWSQPHEQRSVQSSHLPPSSCANPWQHASQQRQLPTPFTPQMEQWREASIILLIGLDIICIPQM